MGKYFAAFPQTVYANAVCTDIIRSNQLSDEVVGQTSLYYKFTVKEGQRPDTISFDYYNNSYFDWLVYKANGIVDPYYDWYMSQNTFDAYITEKYGSIGQAIEKVIYYRVNWQQDSDRRLPSAAYDALSSDARTYWRPGTDLASYYVRKELDWKLSTNMIVKAAVANVAIFAVGDYVNQVTGNVVEASGEVAFVGTDHILIQHIEGSFEINKTIQLPLKSGSTTTTDTPIIINRNIPLSVSAYWSKVNAYDYELELNEDKKTIRLLSKEYSQRVQREHEESINNE